MNADNLQRLTMAQLLTRTDKLVRNLKDHCRHILPPHLGDFRALTRPKRRRSSYPTNLCLANALAKLEEVDQETQVMVQQLEEYLLAVSQRCGEQNSRRQVPRRHGEIVEVFIHNAAFPGQPWRGGVFERSANGLGITVPQKITAGTRLRVLPVKVLPKTPWVSVIVRNCRAEKTGWKIGCQFQVTPPWPVLAQFG